MNVALALSHLIFSAISEVNAIIVFILEVRKLKLKKIVICSRLTKLVHGSNRILTQNVLFQNWCFLLLL